MYGKLILLIPGLLYTPNRDPARAPRRISPTVHAGGEKQLKGRLLLQTLWFLGLDGMFGKVRINWVFDPLLGAY
jgi:hypothetical protein